MPKYSIVVPFHNEEENVTVLYARLKQVMEQVGEPFELVLVDDGSRDRTYKLLEEIAAVDSRVLVVKLRRNFGQTSALAAGFDHARGMYVLAMDGDLQHDPNDIPAFLEKLEEGYDVVSGWRKDRQDDYIQRNVPSILANKLISLVSGVPLHDFGCSLKAYKRHVVQGIRLYGEMHRFLPIYASWHGAKISEVVVNHHPRLTGSSKYGLERVVKVLLDLLVVKFLDRAAAKPMYVFGGCGIFSLAISVFTFVWMLGLKINRGTPFIETPLPLIVVVTFMIAMMCILLGLLAEMITRTFYESQGKAIYSIRSTRNFQEFRAAPESSAEHGARDHYQVS